MDMALAQRQQPPWRRLWPPGRVLSCLAGAQTPPLPPTTDFASETTSPGAVRPADPAALRAVFDKYATHTDDTGQPYIEADEFVRNFLLMYQHPDYNRETVMLIAGAADTNKSGRITFEQFAAFEAKLRSPDALYLTAFEMFDTSASGTVSFDEFRRIIRHTSPVIEMDFDFDCTFIRRYFGRDKKKTINYMEFSQLLHDFYEEQGNQAFKRYDKDSTGNISLTDFQTIMTSVKRHLLTKFVFDNLLAVSGATVGKQVSFPYYVAFNSLLGKMELLKRIYMSMAHGNLGLALSKQQFLQAAQSYAAITPYEIEILYNLADFAHPGTGKIVFRDLERMDPERLKRVSSMQRVTNVKVADSAADRGVLVQVLESMYRFTLGSIAGGCGATAVYPIDLVKTRMQNQRLKGGLVGEVMYRHSLDCFTKVIRHEGVKGLYRGLLPQIVGVAPEKAIKLTTNDFVRDKFTDSTGKIPLFGEIIAGGCGGASQVIFTNPLEIVKIRLQVAGELAGPKVGLMHVLADLGVLNLYRGARACFLRDIPFSAIYFPTYAHAKLYTADHNGHNGAASVFASAFVAGVPAAGLVTPADVIKTRLQVAARAGQTTYSGVLDCYRKVSREEGHRALWKGSVARILRSSPQFAVTLLTYEFLQRIFYVDFAGNRPAGSEVPAHTTLLDERSTHRDHLGGYQLAAATFAGFEAKFGLFLPKFERRAHRPAYVSSSLPPPAPYS